MGIREFWLVLHAGGCRLQYICTICWFSKYGDIKLGQDHEKAQFPFLAWAAMLFSAGIGIDLLFLVPLSH